MPWRWLVGAGILALVLHRTGSGPVLAGLRALDLPTVALACAVTVVTTVACAWRWRLVAGELGVAIGLPMAVAACYRAQLLNTVLPGGVLGDVHRGVAHGRSVGATGAALRAVGWERFAGQVVQAVLAIVVLTILPSPARPVLPAAAGLVLACLAALAWLALRTPGGGGRWWRRSLHAIHDDVRLGLLVRRSWPGVVVASAVATVGHVTVYLLAVRAVGVSAPPATVLPLAVLVLVAAGLPLNLAGWGPREGMAAWAFAAAGLGAGPGVAAAVAYGAVVLVANLPGAVVLLAVRGRHAPGPAGEHPAPAPRTPLAVGGGSDA
ncbi:hypothetical protein ASG94_00915 [Nocardioides sp. Soil805]|nr:hypothetical protein ASG94_00915 [Nocardioides sp. Soil805]